MFLGLGLGIPFTQKVNGASLALFSGGKLDNFSPSNQALSAANDLQNFGPGQSLFVIVDITNTGDPGGQELILGCYNGAFGTGTGWRLFRFIGGVGQPYLTSSTSPLFLSGAVFVQGVNQLCINWAADNTVSYSLNGGAYTACGALAPTAPGVSSKSTIGSLVTTDSGWINFTSGGMVAYAILSREVTEVEAVVFTSATSGNRFVVPAAFVGDAAGCTIDFDARRDWSAGTFSTLGSTPVTFNVTGSAHLTDISEHRFATTDAYYHDGKIKIVGSDYVQRNSFSRIRLTTDAIRLDLEIFSNLYPTYYNLNGGYDAVGVLSDNSYQGKLSATATSTKQLFGITLPAGSGKVVDIVEGPQTYVGVTPPPSGTFVQAVRYPVASATTPVKPQRPMTRVVILGDSIATAFQVTEPQTDAIPTLLRSTTTTGITAHCWGNNALAHMCPDTATADAVARTLTAELDATGRDILINQLGTNDYALNLPLTPFLAMYAYLMDAIYALAPSTELIFLTPFKRISPASEDPNSYGSLQAYRDGIEALAVTRPWATVWDGTSTSILTNQTVYNTLTNPTGAYATDGLHIVNVGAANVASYITMTLSLT